MITVLVVDDADDVRESLAELLVLEGFDVRTAADGRAALDDLRARGPVDVILLDLTMPVMDGRQFLEARGAEPALAAIPVVVLSAIADRVALPPIAASLRKPVGAEVVLSTLRAAARGSTPPALTKTA